MLWIPAYAEKTKNKRYSVQPDPAGVYGGWDTPKSKTKTNLIFIKHSVSVLKNYHNISR